MADILKMKRRRAIAALALWCAAPSASADDGEFGERVRSYLLSNPQVILEVFEILQAQEDEAAAGRELDLVEEHSPAIFDPRSPWVGSDDAREVIVEFADYRCGYCRANAALLHDWVAVRDGRKIIFKEFPILGDESRDMAEAMLAVRHLHGDKAYQDLHLLLMTYQGQTGPIVMRQLMEAAGYDLNLIAVTGKSEEVQAELARNAELAATLSIQGTPSFVVGGQILRGFLDEVRLDAMFPATKPQASEG